MNLQQPVPVSFSLHGLILLFALVSYQLCGQSSSSKLQPSQLFQLGEKAIQNKAYKTALAHFNECLRLDPYFWDAYHSRGSTKEKLGDPKGEIGRASCRERV